MDELYTIGRLAGMGDVNVQTIRYYEKRGLIRPAGRRESGYRVYSDESLRRLKFIRHAKELGFNLEEIRSLLDLKVDETSACDRVKEKAEAKLEKVEERIRRLKSVRKVLRQLVDACNRQSPTGECPILETLEK